MNNPTITHLSKIMLLLMEVDNKSLDMDLDISPMFCGLLQANNLRFKDEFHDDSDGWYYSGEGEVRDFFFEQFCLITPTQEKIEKILSELTEPIVIKL